MAWRSAESLAVERGISAFFWRGKGWQQHPSGQKIMATWKTTWAPKKASWSRGNPLISRRSRLVKYCNLVWRHSMSHSRLGPLILEFGWELYGGGTKRLYRSWCQKEANISIYQQHVWYDIILDILLVYIDLCSSIKLYEIEICKLIHPLSCDAWFKQGIGFDLQKLKKLIAWVMQLINCPSPVEGDELICPATERCYVELSQHLSSLTCPVLQGSLGSNLAKKWWKPVTKTSNLRTHNDHT